MEQRRLLNGNLKKNIDVIVAFGVMAIVLMMIIPLPTWVLDILIAINITIASVIILLTMFTTEVLQFSSFPTLLLVTTLFRLGLNISSTRLILSQHDAGKIIEAFGSFVAGNNYIVGVTIFLILIIIQFVVITNGAGRVSEVSARFTLDAMPGKQMSVDADLNAGLITEAQAKERRKKLQMEADFYGAMDGASKFVKGDAIAGIVITLINIIVGIIIGVLVEKMPAGEAAKTYVRLTVGDGLVSQIPSILISTASGILVTRSASDTSFGSLVTSQLTKFPKVLGIASAVMLFLAFVPGMPWLPFLILSLCLAAGAYFLYKDEKEKIVQQIETEQQEIIETENREPENVSTLIQVEPMEIEIGYGLIPLADEASGGDLLQRIASVRRQCAIEMGIVVQPIRIRDNLQLNTDEYTVKIRGTVIAKGEVMPSMLLCMDPTSENIDLPGIRTVEPTFGLPAVWINKDQKEDAEINGFTVVDPTTVMVTHLTETIKIHAYELLGRQETKMIVDSLKEKYNAVVEELIPDLMTLGEVQKVLQNLLREKVTIRDMVTILETLADYSINTKDIELLTEYVRMALGRSICNPLLDENRAIIVATLNPEIEDLIGNSIQKSVQGSFPAVEPEITQRIFNSMKNILDNVYFNDNQPVFLVSPKIRPAFRRLTELVFPSIIILSLNEIPNDVEIRTEGVVTL
ncbi:flagellar biosynthesis protein FlhA [Clostridium sp. KNHs214]|uniref:flagellar biosynthesis protein FlhA n=1 Tax=Clostridium sp. KNHs214 TaxID=1540257 RepID=UPI000556C656|nr:flagellar biosynthesis protein FlhA [Clostridium sp. KNHs214]